MSFNDRGNSLRGRESNRGNRDNNRGGSRDNNRGGFRDNNRGGFRDNNRGGFRGGSSGPRELYPVVCSDCGVETQVPFKPTEGRPVYCRDCLPKHRKF